MDTTVPEFQVSIETPRVSLVEGEEGYKIAWDADDFVTVFFNDGGNSKYKFVGEDGATAGKIEAADAKEGTKLENYYAVYPYNEATTLEGDVVSLTLPAEQAYVEGTFAPGVNTMVATATGEEKNEMVFENVCGYIRVNVYGDTSVSTITLQGKGEEALSGAAAYNMAEGTLAISNEGGKTITLNCGEGVALGATEAEAKSFWLVVPPVTFAQGYTITVADAQEHTVEVESEAVTIEGNAISTTVVEFKTIPDPEPVTYLFDAQFQSDGNAIDGGKFGLTIQKMTRDDVTYQFMSAYTNSTYATPVARYYWTPSNQGNESFPMQKTGYYLVDFSENAEFKTALNDGFTVEAVYMEPLATPQTAVVVGTNAWSIYKAATSTLNASYNVNIATNPWDNWGTVAIGQNHDVAKFHHTMMVYDPTAQKIQLFVDGALDVEGVLEVDADSGAVKFDIGERLTIGARSMMRTDDNYASAIHHWYGDIAMVRIHDNVFTADEVAAQYAATTMPTAAELAAPQPIYDAQFNTDLSLTNQGTLGAEVTAKLTVVNATDPENPLANANVKVESVNGINVLHFTHEITKHNAWDTYLIDGDATNGQPDGTTYVIDNAALLEKLNDGDFTVELIAAVGHSYPEKPKWGRYSPFSTQGMNVCYWGNTMQCKTINTGNAKERNVTPPYVPAVGEYHHFVFVPNVLGHTAGQMEVVYSNGENALANAYTMYQTADFTIGASHWPSTISRPFNGYIAAIRIYDNHLGPLEVAALYENAKPMIDALNAANAQ